MNHLESGPMFYIFCPEPMVKSLGNTLKKIGVPTDYIELDAQGFKIEVLPLRQAA